MDRGYDNLIIDNFIQFLQLAAKIFTTLNTCKIKGFFLSFRGQHFDLNETHIAPKM